MTNLKHIFAAAEAWKSRRRNGLISSVPIAVRDYRLRKAKDDEYEARKSEVPTDTRTLTQTLLGDPLPGRSALDRRRA